MAMAVNTNERPFGKAIVDKAIVDKAIVGRAIEVFEIERGFPFREDPKYRACKTVLEAVYGERFGKSENEEDAQILEKCVAAVRDHIAAEEDRIAKREDRDGSFVASNDMNGLP